MRVDDHASSESLGPVLVAPDVGCTDPKHLLRTVLQTRQTSFLLTGASLPIVVGQVGLLDAAVVRYVLSLGVDAVDLCVSS